jgi:hypothetical protein
MEEQNTDFAEFITDLRSGICHQELSDKLRKATKAVTETGKMATVSLGLKIKLKGQQVIIVDEIKAKIPEHDKPETIMFFDENGNLSRCDFRQRGLDELKEAKPKAELVSINKETGELREVNGND